MTVLPNGANAPAPKHYTFVDIFAGIGGFRFGFEPKGGTCVWSCEINPHSRKTYSHNHDEREEDIFPDIRAATNADIPDHDVLIAGFACFADDTAILTEYGHIPIQDIRPGTLVLTHNGRWRPVTHVTRRSDVPIRIIKAKGLPPTATTDEHPFFTTDRFQPTGSNPPIPWWLPANRITQRHSLGQVLPPVRPNTRPLDFWWLTGRYLANGDRVTQTPQRWTDMSPSPHPPRSTKT